MKRRTMQQIVPAVMMAGAAAVPVVTTVEILTHLPGGGSGAALQPSAAVAVASSNSGTGAANLAGIITAAVAAVPGLLDWLLGIPGSSPAKGHGLTHMLLNAGALVLFIICNVLYLSKFTSAHPGSVTAGIILSLLGMLLTIAAGYYGYMMVQTDHVGIEVAPQREPAGIRGR